MTDAENVMPNMEMIFDDIATDDAPIMPAQINRIMNWVGAFSIGIVFCILATSSEGT